MQMTRVVLHVGLPKTGSSAVQAMLRANEEKLAREHGTRILLARELKPLYRAIATLSKASRPGPFRWMRLHWAVRRLRRRVSAYQARSIILSHEMILGFNSGTLFKTRFDDGPAQAIRALRKVFKGDDMRWVVYERDPAHQKRSAYNQNVKIRQVSSEFAAWERENCPPGVFDQLVGDLKAELGDRLSVLDYDTEKRAGGLFGAQLLTLAGLSDAALRDLEVTPAVNVSIPPDLLDLKRRCNALGLSKHAGREVMKLLEEAYRLPPPETDEGAAHSSIGTNDTPSGQAKE